MPTETYDVIVAGGGSAGVAAAVTAARGGARTLLLERHSVLGGMGSAAQVHTLCGLYHPDVSQPPAFLNPGLPTEIGEWMMQRSSQTQPDLMGRLYVLRHEPAMLAHCLAGLCAAERLLTVKLSTWLESLRHEHERWHCEHGSARAMVDATGDALLARLLGPALWEMAPGMKLYRPSYVVELQGLSGEAIGRDRVLSVVGAITRAVQTGQLPRAALGSALRAAPGGGSVFLTVDLEAGSDAWNPLEVSQTQQLMAEARELSTQVVAFLKAEVEGFHTLESLRHPLALGVRESARWVGDYTLTADDVLQSRRFDDEVALAGWPLEMRETARGPRWRWPLKAEPAGIPARCLRNSAVPGMAFAGRCLSADHEALASVRVMGTCLATGQAAGRLVLHSLD